MPSKMAGTILNMNSMYDQSFCEALWFGCEYQHESKHLGTCFFWVPCQLTVVIFKYGLAITNSK